MARLACLSVILALAACTLLGPRTALHTFEFNFERDSPDVELREWRYGDGRIWYQRTGPRSTVGTIRQSTGVSGFTPVGTEIWAKWRERATGRVCEETARFGRELPDNMDHHTITFHIKNGRLAVFLLDKYLHRSQPPGTPYYRRFEFVQIYPNTDNPNPVCK